MATAAAAPSAPAPRTASAPAPAPSDRSRASDGSSALLSASASLSQSRAPAASLSAPGVSSPREAALPPAPSAEKAHDPVAPAAAAGSPPRSAAKRKLAQTGPPLNGACAQRESSACAACPRSPPNSQAAPPRDAADAETALVELDPLASPPPSPTAEPGSVSRPRRARRAPRKFEVDDVKNDAALRKALEKSRLERRRIQLDYASLPPVPVIKLSSMEEFLVNPISLFEKLEHYGKEFGAVKILPPDGWQPPFSLEGLLTDELEFHIRVQDIHTLMQGQKFRHPPQTLCASSLKALDREMKKKAFGSEDPSLTEIEALYWKSVESSTPELTVQYAADLKTNEVGSGFPTKPAAGAAETEAPGANAANAYATHPWNLTRLAREKGSLLASYHRDVAGVTSPWLYIGMVFSTFCWHTEDNYFAACNYHHWGSPKIWYLIPPSRAPSVERLLQSYLVEKDSDYVLHSLTVQLPPSLFVENRLPVYRIEQHANEFLMLWPRTFHAGFNTGFNCNEACNFAPASWLPWGRKSVRQYRYVRSTCVPFHQLLLRAAAESPGASLSASQMLHLCRALMELLHEETLARKAALEETRLLTVPMVLDAEAFETQLAPLRLQGAYAVEGIAAELLKCDSDLRSLFTAANLLLRLPPAFPASPETSSWQPKVQGADKQEACIKAEDAEADVPTQEQSEAPAKKPRVGARRPLDGVCTAQTGLEEARTPTAETARERQASRSRARVDGEGAARGEAILKSEEEEEERSLPPLEVEGAVAFLRAVSTVAALPVKDCDTCQSCCAVSCVVCPHSLEHSCLNCIASHGCLCAQRLVLTRFSLPALKGLVDFAVATFLHKCEEERAAQSAQAAPDAETGEAEAAAPAAGLRDAAAGALATPKREGIAQRAAEDRPGSVKKEGEEETRGANGDRSAGSRSKKRRVRRGPSASPARSTSRRRGAMQDQGCQSPTGDLAALKRLEDELRADALYVHLPTMEDLVRFEEDARPQTASDASLFPCARRGGEAARGRKTPKRKGTGASSPRKLSVIAEADGGAGLAKEEWTAETAEDASSRETEHDAEGGSSETREAVLLGNAALLEGAAAEAVTAAKPQTDEATEASGGTLVVQAGAGSAGALENASLHPWSLRAAVDNVDKLFAVEAELFESRGRRGRRVSRSSTREASESTATSPTHVAETSSVPTPRGRKRIKETPAEEDAEKDPWRTLAEQVTWRYFLTALKHEEDENDEKILPVFKKAAARERGTADAASSPETPLTPSKNEAKESATPTPPREVCVA
ncbi:histone lysine demethylase JMJC1/KDM5D/JARID1D [Besnoitia besnoiti]|uniref:Histone lysine demethylase JMJC1/KDM5D/JARID1D n=1 Tax=Besnoitia besnoiti TaxID=94643 RepID=A0A2A9ME67_BESBE|nr:histone lysine demethylase JMJC1/KDM5D/JARID1D [Besnoitia besnoiti]PFH33963.1 histone lysine demethylase JMJC1/KDM5D/JARID1D [Besnoitia besnoiti]